MWNRRTQVYQQIPTESRLCLAATCAQDLVLKTGTLFRPSQLVPVARRFHADLGGLQWLDHVQVHRWRPLREVIPGSHGSTHRNR